ncbi:MAG: insulinase family protein [Pedosphaera sp.]|nr:insulinase family protein [Pedosphaera sp.]
MMPTMFKRVMLLVLGLLVSLSSIISWAEDAKFFPYPYSVDRLPNQLQVVTVPLENQKLVALYIVVRTGSRNEVEAGKSGFAHFFEHMMFRGSENFTPEQRDSIMKRAGAEGNAYTSDDRTVYHQLFAKEDLDPIMKLEADRFQRLKYAVPVYKTETLAVLGEYNKNSANPVSKLNELTRATAFSRHTYKHTTMGFVEDIQGMPNEYDYSLQFYQRYYRPENCTILLVGAIDQPRALELTRKYFGDWKAGNHHPEIPTEPVPTGPKRAHLDWPSPTLPYLLVAFRGPAYSDTQKDKAALDFLAPIAFGEDSELHQKLVLKEQKVDMLAVDFEDHMDPELFSIYVRVKNPVDLPYVEEQIAGTIKKFSSELIPIQKLNDTRSRMRYGTALGLDSSNAIGGFLAPYIALAGTPDTVNKVFEVYRGITPEDIRSMTLKYLNAQGKVVVTLTTKTVVTKETK